MLELLSYVGKRFSEPSTYASLAALLATMHVSISQETLSQLSLYGTLAAGVLGFVLKERSGGKTPEQIAAEVTDLVRSAQKTAPMLLAIMLSAALLVACSSSQTQKASADLQKASDAISSAQMQLGSAKQKLDAAMTLWGVVKGIAEVAQQAAPSKAAEIGAAISQGDQLVSKANALSDAAAPAADAVLSLSKQLTDQANALLNSTAPNIKALPSSG